MARNSINNNGSQLLVIWVVSSNARLFMPTPAFSKIGRAVGLVCRLAITRTSELCLPIVVQNPPIDG